MPPGPQPSLADNQLLRDVSRYLSAPRLIPFLTVTGGHVRTALQLYAWNVRLSGAVHELLHGFEVVLRNAVDEQLSIWNAVQRDRGRVRSSDWLLDPAPLLVRLTRGNIATASEHARRALRHRADPTPRHADVLAQLPMGTWRFLLPDHDPGRRHLWQHALHRAFPELQSSPEQLTARVQRVYALRNRVAHLEPLLATATVRSRVSDVAQVLGAINATTAAWIMSQQRVTTTISQRPGPADLDPVGTSRLSE